MVDSNGSQIDVSFIIVNYRQNDLLRDCLKSLIARTAGLSYEIIVVDNDPDKRFLAALKRDYSGCRVIESKGNVGFARANNAGARVAAGRCLFFVNPDIIFKSNAALTLFDFLNSHPEAGGAGCRLENADGSLQFSIRRYPTVANQFGEALFLHHLFRHRLVGAVVCRPGAYSTIQPVEWASGAALMIERSGFDAVGGFDEDYFLYSEEEDLCFRLAGAGRPVYFNPEGVLVHLGGESGSSPGLLGQLVASKALFFTKNSPALKRPLLRAAWVLRLALRYMAWLARSALRPAQRLEARSKLNYYQTGLKVALKPRPKPRQLP